MNRVLDDGRSPLHVVSELTERCEGFGVSLYRVGGLEDINRQDKMGLDHCIMLSYPSSTKIV
jgi:hypothetical protein